MSATSLTAHVPSYVVRNPAKVFTTASTFLGFFALTPEPPLLAVAALLAVIRLSAQTFIPRAHGYSKLALQVGLVSVAAGTAHLAPGIQALSTPNVALVVFSGISLVVSAFAVVVAGAAVHASKYTNSPWAQITLFPALWASAWGFMSRVSPVGQLVTWSPVLGLGPYGWIRGFLGQWGVDWITAAWAVVLSEVLGDWLVGDSDNQMNLIDHVDHERLIDHENEHVDYLHTPSVAQLPVARSRSLLSLFLLLLLSMVPTYFTSYLPTSTHSDDVTPFGVACAMPDPKATEHGRLDIEDYITATKQIQSQANIVFWPESAVRFESPDEREKAFARIQNVTDGNKFIGVSFEEYVPAQGKRRNGFALIQRTGPPVFEYYKRNLVPIAESFSLSPGHDAPSIYTIKLSKPLKGHNIPVSASICLDFAHSSSFTSFTSRPALILAPARTWHIGVGSAMWEQAKARASETGSTVVWCDGGEGGISGIASGAYSEIIQVGPGSWVKRLGIPYPFDERRTTYTWGGDGLAFVVVWALLGQGYVARAIWVGGRRVRTGVAGSMAFVRPAFEALRKLVPQRRRSIGPTVDEQTSLLG
ncbi:hypothetical protein BDY19DRAFT_1071077 [Irpex rosettiformis]|uniref:Uncharacterized protein n=1 Tax=Irpex rosettiformis TaxID=378272 RepID=A0ACB8U3B8_9APHY|nr:hypothetical protein BDY19DRAFT_1071077 [Irpex rosettiformis]